MLATNALRAVAPIAALLLAACASGPQIQSFQDYNPAVDFSGYRTWSFISDTPMIVASTSAPMNPLLQTRIMQAVRADLEAKGFRYVDDAEHADAVVSFTIGSRAQIRVDQYPVSYRDSFGRYYPTRTLAVGYGSETVVRQYTEGQLAIDVFDVKSRAPAFHGSATSRVRESDRENPEPLLRAAVGEALAGFPPGRSGSVAEPSLVPSGDGG